MPNFDPDSDSDSISIPISIPMTDPGEMTTDIRASGGNHFPSALPQISAHHLCPPSSQAWEIAPWVEVVPVFLGSQGCHPFLVVCFASVDQNVKLITWAILVAFSHDKRFCFHFPFGVLHYTIF